jgi:Ca-activated chloride channel family protein
LLTFLYPWMLVLAPLPWVVRRLAPPYQHRTASVRVPFLLRLARASGQSPSAASAGPSRRAGSLLFLTLTWLCLLAALARPQWLEPPVTRTIPVRDLLLAVDLSSSMETKDFQDPSGKKVDRLTAVKQVLDDFLSRRKGDRVGLIVFGNAPFVQAPFTQDLEVCRELLQEVQVGMAGPKTAMGDAIGLAATVFERTKVPEKVLIVLTDGNDTGSLVTPQKAAEIARDQKVTIYTVAVGDPKAAGEDKLDEVALRQVAETTGGSYSHAGNRQELEAVYGQLDKLPTQPAQTLTRRPRRELFWLPLAAGFLISVLTAARLALARSPVAASSSNREAA